jgi:hypothetical protein
MNVRDGLQTRAPADTAPAGVAKQDGVTRTERGLARLCERSFLSLWSYPGVYRDQNRRGGGDGKEVCDLLVVFGDHVLIFSDKDCRFPETDSLDDDWSRWFRRAVQKSAEQVWGAERWLREQHGRLFLDRRCERPFPVPPPAPERMRVHRIVVAHDAARRCRELLGGSGSLIICPDVEGAVHHQGPADSVGGGSGVKAVRAGLKAGVGYAGRVLPFWVGDLDPARGFVHVFDDTGLDIVMGALDTAADFVAYLGRRESFLRGGRLTMAAGEDDLLAHYLQSYTEAGEHDFVIPAGHDGTVIVPEGEWAAFRAGTEWRARQDANRVSYLWDDLIEQFNTAILDGSSPVYPETPLAMQELAARALALPNRLQRRVLSTALGGFLSRPRFGDVDIRLFQPLGGDLPFYAFLAARYDPARPYGEYRAFRQAVSGLYVLVIKYTHPHAPGVVVIASEPPDQPGGSSMDVAYGGVEPLTPDEVTKAREAQAEFGFGTNFSKPVRMSSSEYPGAPGPPGGRERRPGREPSIRNAPCRCGSGRKTKRCCGC